MTIVLIYSALFIVTSLYAALLSRFKHVWEPDLTWLEVVIGTVLCLIAPALAARWLGGDWQDYERRVWLAFIAGGIPIVTWQLGAMVRSWRSVERRIRSNNGSARPAPLASERRSGPPNDN